MRTFLNRALLGAVTLLIGLPAYSANWDLDPGMSTVVFKYNYGSDEYQGTFKNIDATFDIDPMRPGSCKFDVTINIENIDVDSPEVLDYLLDYELFDVDTWPTATFKAEKCNLTGVTSFESEGTLTIRDQTNPMTFPFDLSIETCDGQICFHLTSSVTLLRLEYGVGQGYWANTAEVPNEVEVEVDVYATQR
ncbi:MAG: YceI family protein [Gammaproteobacteria bacterium]|jgi:polyisoprenoid-binding protein YceI|nr:YceI family protein [Gammaproteobacteria bacterium]